MSLWRRTRRAVARVTGVEAALQRRLDRERAKHAAEVDRLIVEREYAARQARVQSRRAQAAEKEVRQERRRAKGAEKLYRTNRRRANELSALLRTLDHIPRYEYGSLLPGDDKWSEKWKSRRGIRILFFAKRDYAGSFYKWAAAINQHSEHAARLVVTAPHQYGYPIDLLLPNPNLLESDWKTLWREADVLHLKDETGFLNGSNRLPTEMLTGFAGPRVFTQYGGYARKHREDPEYEAFAKTFDEVVSMTPDLCFDWLGPEPHYVPHSIDCDVHPFLWSDSPLIGHSPSTRARKGTEDFLAAVDVLAQDFNIELDLIEGVSHEEAVHRKRHLGLFFDQAGRENPDQLGIDSVIGWYGNSALEAAVYGVPTIAHLSDDALIGAEKAGVEGIRDIPIVNTPLGVEGIRSTLHHLLEMTSDERQSLAIRTRAFVDAFHSQSAVAKRLSALYDGLG